MKTDVEPIPFYRPCFDDDELLQLKEALDSGWLTSGPKVRELEAAVAEFTGCRHAVALNSCTAAMHLALEALVSQRSDSERNEVIVPTMTFGATASVIEHVGARPVFVDCRPDTLNLDEAAVQRVIGRRTLAIMPVHYAGHPCDMTALCGLAECHGAFVVEDAAHALSARYHGQKIGNIGHMTAFSFYANKNITTGEGGMLCTNNDGWADRVRLMALHGITRDAWKRYSSEGSWYYEITAPGFKYNLPDLLAGLGIAQLRKLARFQEARRRIAATYTAGFRRLEAIQPPTELEGIEHAWHLYVVRLNTERLTISRDRLVDELKAKNIGVSVHFIPLHIHPYYRDRYGYRPNDFPEAFAAYQRILSLPIYPAMRDDEVQRVIETVCNLVGQYQR